MAILQFSATIHDFIDENNIKAQASLCPNIGPKLECIPLGYMSALHLLDHNNSKRLEVFIQEPICEFNENQIALLHIAMNILIAS